eukprot:5475592-Lingulodinium_polyedra.AAC.1
MSAKEEDELEDGDLTSQIHCRATSACATLPKGIVVPCGDVGSVWPQNNYNVEDGILVNNTECA